MMKTCTYDSEKTQRMRKKLSKCATHKALLPGIIKAYSLYSRLCFMKQKVTSVLECLFTNLSEKKTQQPKNNSPKPDAHNAQLQSQEPVSTKHLTLANAIT